MLSHLQKPLTAQTQLAVRVSTVLCLCVLFAGKVWAQAGFEIGISVHLANDAGQVSSQLNLAGQVGATSIRDDVPWAEVERQQGNLAIPPSVDNLVNQALHAGFRPVLILDYGNQFYDSGDKPLSPQALNAFVRYAVFVTQHFKGRVNTYEMWNEWNGMVGNTHRGAAQDYVRFLQAVYPAVKAVDPSAVFIGGAIGGFKPEWLAAMVAAGGLRFCDAISIHPYNFDQPARTADGWAQEMLDTEGIIHRYTGGHEVPLYITEMGWPT
jgi:polysaccharide biosynthesis protein PslG